MPSLPAASVTLTLSVLLPVSVCPDKLQVFAPTEVVAAAQVEPLSSDTYTTSPAATLADKVPLMVCAAVLVMKSVLLLPVSAEKLLVATVVVGGVVSST